MIKRMSFLVLVALLGLNRTEAVSHACTDFVVKAQDGTIVNGRSMEFAQAMQSLAVVHPIGETVHSTGPGGKKGLSWTTRFGYVAVTSMGNQGPNDGMNEKGLSLGFLWFAGAKYPDVPARGMSRALEVLDAASWLLGNFSTVEEVKKAVAGVHIWGAQNQLLGGVPPLHFAVHDADGKNLVIEFVDGKMNVHDNPVGVLTNVPSFEWQLINIRNYANLTAVDVQPFRINGFMVTPTGHGSGLHGLPGDSTPPSRFIRTVVNTQLSAPAKDAVEVVNLAEHILNAVDIPKGTARLQGQTMQGDYTQWAVVKDLTNKVLFFRSYEDLSLKAIDLKKLDFSTGAPSKSVPIAGTVDRVSNVNEQLR